MKKAIALLLVVIMALGLFAGCAPSTSVEEPAKEPAAEAPATETPAEEEPAAEEPAAEEPAERNPDVSILWAGGGNGEYANFAADYLKSQGANVSLEYNVNAHEVLQPMMVAGNPPDIVMVQTAFFNHFEAIQAGAFQKINDLLETKVLNSDKTVYEAANAGLVDSLKVGDDYYLLPTNMNVGGLYYNKAMFEQYGWEVPDTWDELIALCETIKSTTDIAPIAFPGMYPYYFDCFFLPQLFACGNGLDTLDDINHLKEGFWLSDAAVEAAERVQYLRDNGYFLENLISLSHTETQMEFINGNVAIICCGQWLENEMAGNWPEGFELTYMPTPSGKNEGDPHYARINGQFLGLPADAANKDWNADFLAAYYSEESAIRIAEECGVVISPEYVENEKIREALPASVVNTFEEVNKSVGFTLLASKWYAEWYKEYQNEIALLVSGEIDAAEFCQQMEDLSAATRNDDSITKY